MRILSNLTTKQKPIILADISFVSNSESAVATGVGRVVFETVTRLISIEDFDFRITGCFGGDWNPVITNLRAQQWCQTCGFADRFVSSVRVRSWVFARLSQLQFRIDKGKTSKTLFTRALRYIVKRGCTSNLDIVKPDVFLSYFFPFPDSLPESARRVAIVYDIYPLLFPNEAGQAAVGNLQHLLSGLRPDFDSAIAISNFTKAEFTKHCSFPPLSVTVAPLAADKIFSPKPKNGVSDKLLERFDLVSNEYFLYVGNIHKRKNFGVVLEAFCTFIRSNPDWHGCLAVVGNPAVSVSIDEIHSYVMLPREIKNRIKKLGMLNDSDLAVIYSNALGFLFPSFYEGFGLPVLEAMCCGTPVICSNATSLPEIVADSGFLCSANEPSQFCDAMHTLAYDKSFLIRLKHDGLARSSEFNWDATASRFSQALTRALRIGNSGSISH